MARSNPPIRRYKVAPKDNIYVIARRFKTTPEVIARLNAIKGIVATERGWDFLPGRLLVGDYLIVPATGAGAPGVVQIKRAKGQRPLRRPRVNGLSDEACGDGWHAEEDFWGNIECIQDDYVDPGDENDYPPEGGDDDWKSYLSIPEVASSINAYNSGQTGEQFANSISFEQYKAFLAVCSILSFISSVSTIIGGVFVVALCAALQDLLHKKTTCGPPFIQEYPGGPCIYPSNVGQDCFSSSSGYWAGVFGEDGHCIYDKQKTDAMDMTGFCDPYPGSTLWRSPAAGEGWFCLQGCGANETLDKSDGYCACNAGYKRNGAGDCVKNVVVQDTQSSKVPAKPEPIAPTNEALTPTNETVTATDPSTEVVQNQSSEGMSQGAKVAVGVSVFLAVVAVAYKLSRKK